jgi:aspartyl-tRNA(Asn)/glutamyl-tRNA(Gln) amidotransferase subunit A
MLAVSAGPDARDPYALPASRVDYLRELGRGVRGLRVAYADDLGFAEAVDPEVARLAAAGARAFRELGCRLTTIRPRWPSPRASWFAIFYGGLATRLGPYRDRREEIEPGLMNLVDTYGAAPLGAYVQAWFDRTQWWEHPRALFERYDLLLTPTVACPAFPVGLDNPTEIAGKPVQPISWTPFTFPFNLTGQPAASVPCGFTKGGLPVGLQVVGRRFEDATVLRAAAAFERARPWREARPPLA